MGGRGGAAKAHAAMVKEYGAKKADEVFYGKVNKMKKRKRHTMLRGT